MSFDEAADDPQVKDEAETEKKERTSYVNLGPKQRPGILAASSSIILPGLNLAMHFAQG